MNKQPPSFYEADKEKWKNKFAKAVADREAYKKRYLSGERKTILATNDNFIGKDADRKLQDIKYTGGNTIPTKSEFKKVMGMRRSRQSNGSFAVLDIEVNGNSAEYEHLITNRKHSKGELQHMMNLRNYKIKSDFKAEEPWCWPPPKSFSPKDQYKDEVAGVKNKLKPNRSNWHLSPGKPQSPSKFLRKHTLK